MLRLLSALMLLAMPICASAQKEDPLEGKAFFGLGIGLDHGGFGVRADVKPIPEVGVFGGVGYALAGLGWNAGAICRILPERIVCPYITGMYGYNAAYVLKVQSSSTQVDSDLYYGPSFGAGVEFMRKSRSAFWNLGVLVPIRSDQLEIDHPDAAEKLWPVTISIGYHFSI